MSTPNAEAVGALMAAEMEKLAREGDAFNQSVKEQQTKMGDVYNAMFERLTQPKSKPLPTEIQEIVNTLLAQPRLIPWMQRALQAKVAELNAAIDGLLGV